MIFNVPYSDLERGDDGFGYITGLYRHTVYQHDEPNATRRIAVIGGLRLPTDSDLDPQISAGLVTTIYKRRSEWDIDLVWMEGLGRSGNNARYDVSWQYRLTPSEYPEWGIPSEWQSVIELGGRYADGSEMVHQLTVGALWVHPSWVFEAGVIQDLNGPDVMTLTANLTMTSNHCDNYRDSGLVRWPTPDIQIIVEYGNRVLRYCAFPHESAVRCKSLEYRFEIEFTLNAEIHVHLWSGS